jgi:ribosome-binding protein aMBF1 (putative translation factor)
MRHPGEELSELMSPANKKPANRKKQDPKTIAQTGLDRLRRTLQERTAVDGDELFAEIARQVTERRIAWDLSQKELAELCGTTQSAIARLERGQRPPRIDTLQRVANALDCELSVELRPRTKETD